MEAFKVEEYLMTHEAIISIKNKEIVSIKDLQTV
jgi:hypothetical protein